MDMLIHIISKDGCKHAHCSVYTIDVDMQQINNRVDLLNYISDYLYTCHKYKFQYEQDFVLDDEAELRFSYALRLKQIKDHTGLKGIRTITDLIDGLIGIREEFGDLDIYGTDVNTGEKLDISDIVIDFEKDKHGDKLAFVQIV